MMYRDSVPTTPSGDLVWDDEKPSSVVFSDIFDELGDIAEPAYLIDAVIEDLTTGALFGESTSGKSFIAISMSCSVATGHPWAGHEVQRQGPVVYFAGEGRNGILRRVKAWQQHHGIKIPKGRLFLPKTRIEFNEASAKLLVKSLAALSKKHGNPVLMVIDTLARAMPPGSDENSARDMMRFLNSVDQLRDYFRCVAIIIHHTGHGEERSERARGSSAFRAAMDWEILVEKRKKQIRWTKMKDAELPSPITFELVQTGESAVILYGSPSTPPSGPDLTDSEALGLASFIETCNRLGRQEILEDEWRVDFYHGYPGDNQATKRQTFRRVRASLISKKVLQNNNKTYSLVDTDVTTRDNVTDVTE